MTSVSILSSTSVNVVGTSLAPDVGDELMHVLIVILASILVVISFFAYSRKRNQRYLLLSSAFFFLLLSQFITMLEVLFFSNSMLIIPLVGLHLSHLFDLLMLLSFAIALIRDWVPKVAESTRLPKGSSGGP